MSRAREPGRSALAAPWLAALLGLATGAACLYFPAAAAVRRIDSRAAFAEALAAARTIAFALGQAGPPARAADLAAAVCLPAEPAGGAGPAVIDAHLAVECRALAEGRFLLHPQAGRVGTALDPTDLGDKQAYDLDRQVLAAARAETPVLGGAVLAPGPDPTSGTVAAPILGPAGEIAGGVQVSFRDGPRPDPMVSLAGLLLIVLPVAAAARLRQTRPARPAFAGLMLLFVLASGGQLLLADISAYESRRTAGTLQSIENGAELLTEHGFLPDGQAPFCRHVKLLGGSAFDGVFLDPAAPAGRGRDLRPGPATLGLALAAAALAFGLVVSGLLARAAAALRRHRFAYAAIAPSMAGLALLILFPFAYGVALSFFEVRKGVWLPAGLANFKEVLGHFTFRPQSFYYTLAVTVGWTALNVALHVAIGLTLALVLNRPDLRFRRFYRVMLILPWAVPNYITALIWRGLFHKQFGAVNALLGLAGIEPVSWFQTFAAAFTANVATNVWMGFSFMMVIALGALQSIPGELYEAAEVDGAGRWPRFREITLPLLKPALFPAVILGTIWTFNQFNVIYLVSGGAPGGATDILIVEAYRLAFQKSAYGTAAAYSVVIFLILLTYGLVSNRVTRATEGAFD